MQTLGEAGIANSFFLCLNHRNELVSLHFWEQQKQFISSFGAVLVSRGMVTSLLPWLSSKRVWMDLSKEEEYLLYISRINDRKCLRHLISKMQTLLWRVETLKTFCKSLALAETQFPVSSLGISSWTQIEWNEYVSDLAPGGSNSYFRIQFVLIHAIKVTRGSFGHFFLYFSFPINREPMEWDEKWPPLNPGTGIVQRVAIQVFPISTLPG